jgi:predicted TIM-barrel fold metal-dependent hydrolase
MRALCESHDLVGITHYLGKANDGWLLSDDAEAVFALAAQRNLVISLGAGSEWHGDLRRIARRHPTLPILCHSLGGIWIENGQVSGLSQVLASAEIPNIYIKVAGLHYCSPSGWEYPWRDTVAAFEQIYQSYGPARLCWGSDFPAATRFCTFRQTVEVIRSHCPFLSEDDRRLVFGENLRNLLSRAR